ncbi:MAG TPA: hypothetical protein DDZ81_00905 [Acetobacteraceae bacterium]|jgi:hypothetical protein|nr:hypothetical protein [Acetobacteraceae bacterium]
MMIQNDEISPWVGYVATTLILVAASEAGRFLGMRWARRQPDARAPELTSLEGAGLGLLALLIGFTFAMALNRFDTRLKGVLEEANAISTTELRARLLPEPQATEARKLLGDYAKVRIDLIRGPGDSASLDRAVHRSTELQAELWRSAVAASAADPRSVSTGLFVNSLNEMIDLQEIRLAAGRNRVPPAVLLLLDGVAIVAIGLSSYVGGLAGRWGRIPHTILALMIGIVIAMVADIDRSRSGLITVSQQTMLNLETSVTH